MLIVNSHIREYMGEKEIKNLSTLEFYDNRNPITLYKSFPKKKNSNKEQRACIRIKNRE